MVLRNIVWASALTLSIFTTGCAGGDGSADISGSINGTSFNSAEAVYQGRSHIIFFDREIDCLDTAWVSRNYVDGQDPTEGEVAFNALQFSFDQERPQLGTFSIAGDAPVNGFGLLNESAFEVHRGREGVMTITKVTDDVVEGSFEISFATDSVSGTFEAAYCRNLR